MIDINMRSKVGHPLLFDAIGAHQFCVLVRLGLREYHSLLDFGCGCFRGGKLIIPYLANGNYIGIEPNSKLAVYGLKNELGKGVVVEKRPRLFFWNDFTFAGRIPEVDYVLAQSILTHAGVDIMRKLFSESFDTLRVGGKFVGTFFDAKGTESDTEDGWFGDLIRLYNKEDLRNIATHSGFTRLDVFDFQHPAGQSWFMATKY